MFNIHRKTPVLESLFNWVASQKVFSCEICKIFKNTFFHRISPVTASVIFKLMTIYWAFRNYMNFQRSDLVFRLGVEYHWKFEQLLKQSPVKIGCGPAALLKRDSGAVVSCNFREILHNTPAHQLLKLFHSNFFFFWIVLTQLTFTQSQQ